jgi:anaerobic ribonucleoside-triphosphate reductase activating protein
MVKYLETAVTFEEIPDEVTLAINISNCQNHCEGCHSPWLREDVGEELTPEVLNDLIDKNEGITCVCFMGEGNDIEGLLDLALIVAQRGLAAALYSGRPDVEAELGAVFTYLKEGPYIEEFGPLNKETTNQRMYKVHHKVNGDDLELEFEDITYKFWKRG